MKTKKGEKKTIFAELRDKKNDLEYQVSAQSSLTLVLLLSSVSPEESHVTVRLVGRGAAAEIIGIVVGKNGNNMSLHTLQRHEAPETTSRLLVKSVLTDTARFRYDGAIRVERKAQKTDAYQRNENLLLSQAAHAESKPSLEILANDVRCTHGATVGTVSKEELWYLTTRGISELSGRKIIVDGFLESVLPKISDTIVQQKVQQRLWQILSK